MKADEKKPVHSNGNGKPSNGSTTTVLTLKEAIREEAKNELKQVNAVERILNDLEVLNSRSENRSTLMETLKKLKSFNPSITESHTELIIKDRTNEFRTTATEPLKMIIDNYVAIVETRLRDTENEIAHLAGRLGNS